MDGSFYATGNVKENFLKRPVGTVRQNELEAGRAVS